MTSPAFRASASRPRYQSRAKVSSRSPSRSCHWSSISAVSIHRAFSGPAKEETLEAPQRSTRRGEHRPASTRHDVANPSGSVGKRCIGDRPGDSGDRATSWRPASRRDTAAPRRSAPGRSRGRAGRAARQQTGRRWRASHELATVGDRSHGRERRRRTHGSPRQHAAQSRRLPTSAARLARHAQQEHGFGGQARDSHGSSSDAASHPYATRWKPASADSFRRR